MSTQSTLSLSRSLVGAALVAVSLSAAAQNVPGQPIPDYGPPIKFEQARKVMAAAQALAQKNNWNVAITIVDSGGNPVMFSKFDNTHLISVPLSEGKARTAVGLRRPTKTLEDAVAGGAGGLRYLAVRDQNFTPLEGGFPLVVDGKLIGGIGVSGVASANDDHIAKAGAEALK